MKKLALILVAVICTAIAAQAQFRYGVRLGGTFPHPTGSEHLKGNSGFTGGLACEFQLPVLPFAFGASVNYERRNESYHYTMVDTGVDKHSTLGRNYISVPIDIKYKFSIPIISGLVSPYVLTGPDFAWRLGGGVGPRTHIGWNVGAGLDIINFIQVSGGYRFGMTNINPSDGPKWHDSGAFVAVALLFDI